MGSPAVPWYVSKYFKNGSPLRISSVGSAKYYCDQHPAAMSSTFAAWGSNSSSQSRDSSSTQSGGSQSSGEKVALPRFSDTFGCHRGLDWDAQVERVFQEEIEKLAASVRKPC